MPSFVRGSMLTDLRRIFGILVLSSIKEGILEVKAVSYLDTYRQINLLPTINEEDENFLKIFHINVYHHVRGESYVFSTHNTRIRNVNLRSLYHEDCAAFPRNFLHCHWVNLWGFVFRYDGGHPRYIRNETTFHGFSTHCEPVSLLKMLDANSVLLLVCSPKL